ncbi:MULTISPECIES: SH3 domain-containing protein [Rhizobium]|uniref:SH3 domain-containing protein n=1 Tax=Rhizobium rhododendri TaxID=2506430 RepID=A0ABY8IEU0_9HYPH|nr:MULTISPECIES: SH3 domain-containing protein [Rhizobium]MBZ5763015.1 SH3 domain-containing protein [Rhizobium sp. VS19-DR96]MBZ5768887.1 SH3 domain-containing protein [Rhizobium sp. VS19-DR129.2]MBZ5776515.1 SH3 domain-containing protein [Rhizobium sp. VS19-DRK62.2]MBZ5787671.1 SH3 domain-containing protein [Rhizobium sp. VS19-DR121]MBZ5803459.1 SH3 domain-containing protein [Rhizobium sp. VS19-DR181]
MRKLLLATAALGSVLALPAIAEAASGFSTANVNMRSGPSTAYPAVTLIPIGAPLRINGCLADLPWCDVSFDGGRGWVAGRYVQAVYQQRRIYVGPQYYRPLGIPTITFDLDNYWDRNYRGRDFYRDRDRWAQGPDWQRNGGQPIYRRPPPPPVYDPQDEDQGNWQRRHQRQPDYGDNYQSDDNPPPRHRPRYGDGDGDAGQRYGDPDQGNFDGDNNQPPRRRQQQDQQDQQQPQQQQRPQRDQPPQGQPPRQQPPQAQPQPPQPQPPQQPAPPPPRAQPEAPRPQPQPQAQQPGRSEPPRVIRRNDGQVIVCPDAGPACNEPHSSHN